MLSPTAQLFLAAVVALVPITLIVALLWRRFYREDVANVARTVAKNSALPIGANLLNKVIDFGFAAITLRYLGPEGNGAYAFVALIVGLYFLTISNWGLNDLTVREVASDHSRAPRFFSITLLLRWGITLLLFPAAGALVAGYAAGGIPLTPAATTALLLLLFHLFPASVAAACSASFQALQRMEVPALISVLTAIARTLAGVAALALAPDTGARVVALAAVALIATTLNAAIFFGLQQRMLFRAQFYWDAAVARGLLRESFPLLLNSLLLAVFFRFDVVILRAVSGDAAVGIYDAAYKLIGMTQIVPPYFVAALFPVLARYAIGDRAAFDRAFSRAIGMLQLIAWPAAAYMTVLAHELIFVVGGTQFLPGAAIALMVLIWYLPLSYVNGVIQYALIALRRQRTITIAFGIGAVVNLGLNLIFIPPYGYLAAAIVTIVTEFALLIPLALALRSAGALPPLPRLMWRPALAALLSGGAAIAAYLAAGWVAAAATAPLYVVVLWLLGGIGAEERALMRRVIGR
jgi:O-antigen/teichoic acid export membrane protein